MPTVGSPEGKARLRVWMDPELVYQLELICEAAGRVSKTQALVSCWPDILTVVARRYGVQWPPRRD